MNIELDCIYTDNDISAFAKNHSLNVLKTIRIVWWIMALLSTCFLIYYWNAYYFDLIHCILIGVIAVSLFYLFYNPVQKKIIKSNVYLRGNRVKFAFYDEYFYEKSESSLYISEISVRYENIKAAYETRDHLFIYNLSGSCFIIPRGALAPDEYFMIRAFLASRLGVNFKSV